jgi:two-component system, NarL family, sensor kinase
METKENIKFYFGIIMAILAFAIIAGGFVLAFVRYRRNIVRRQQEMLRMDAEYKKELLLSNIESVEKERMRIAKDIHDEIGSIFSTLSLSVNRMQPGVAADAGLLQSSNQLIEMGIKGVRRIAHSIIPFELELLGIDQALENHFDTFAGLSSADVKYENHTSLQSLKPAGALAVYRIIQELCSNCIKYAKAQHIEVTIKGEPQQFIIAYQDDGAGADLNAAQKGIGLKNIESRVILLNGSLTFVSQPGKGFACRITIPQPLNSPVT